MSALILYPTEVGRSQIKLRANRQTVWLTPLDMAELRDATKQNISLHLKNEGDNPTVGILLCGSKDQSVVRYSVLNGSKQLIASKYRLVLPSEEELRLELQRDREDIEAHKSLGREEDGI